jgi:hypothetical protein
MACRRLSLELVCATTEAVAISQEIVACTKTHTDIPATFGSWARESKEARQAVVKAIRAQFQHHRPATHN